MNHPQIGSVFCKCEIFGIFEDSRGIFGESLGRHSGIFGADESKRVHGSCGRRALLVDREQRVLAGLLQETLEDTLLSGWKA